MRFAGASMRGVIAVAAAVAIIAALLAAAPPATASDTHAPPAATADDVSFTPGNQLHYGSTREAGVRPGPIHDLKPSIEKYLKPSADHSEYAGSGAVEIAGHDGTIVSHQAAGQAVRYASYDSDSKKATELPRKKWVSAQKDTIFDLASMSKLFTSIVAVQLIQQGTIHRDASVASYVPDFGQHGKDDITVRNLLTHTSGLRPDPSPSLCDYDTNRERWDAVNATKPQESPDAKYVYSDMNMMVMQEVIENVTGRSLDKVVADKITKPLGMHDTMYNPSASLKHRIAATEDQPSTGRKMVRGSVHDENAYCLGGVSGHAGMFSTAGDMAVLAQTILNGGSYQKTRILSEKSTRSLMTNLNAKFPDDDHGLGFELNQRWYMDGLSSPVTMGHTGFTGPDIVIDPLSHSFVILMSNRVHPTRDWGSSNPARQAVARDLARALPVQPKKGCTGWYSGTGDNRKATLRLPLDVNEKGGKVDFGLWYDTESTDKGSFQASTDDGKSWKDVPIDLKAGKYSWSVSGTFSGSSRRRWAEASATLPGGVTDLRWRYKTDKMYEGRGVYVDCVRASNADGQQIFNSSRQSDATAFQPDGWSPLQRNGRTR